MEPILIAGEWRNPTDAAGSFRAVNPATGETMTKPADKQVKVTVAKALKDSVNV